MNCLLLVIFVIATTYGLASKGISDSGSESSLLNESPNGGDNNAKLQENGSANNNIHSSITPQFTFSCISFTKAAICEQEAAEEPPTIQTTGLQCNKHESQFPLQSFIDNQPNLDKQAISLSTPMPYTMPSYNKQKPNNRQATPIISRAGSSQNTIKKFDQNSFINLEDLQYNSSEEGSDEDRFGVPKQNGTGAGDGMKEDFTNGFGNYGESNEDNFISDVFFDDYFEFLFMIIVTLYCIQQAHTISQYTSCIVFIAFPQSVLSQSIESSSSGNSGLPIWLWIVIGSVVLIICLCIGGCIMRKVMKKSKSKYKYEQATETEEKPATKLKTYHKRNMVTKSSTTMLNTQTTVHVTPNTPTDTYQDERSYADINQDQLSPFDSYINTIDDIYQQHKDDIQNSKTANIDITKEQQSILYADDEKVDKLQAIFKSSDVINSDLLNKPIIIEFCNRLKQHVNWPMNDGTIISYFKIIIFRLHEIENNPLLFVDSGRATNIDSEDTGNTEETEETKENSNAAPPLLGDVIAPQDPTAVSASNELHEHESESLDTGVVKTAFL